MFVLASVCVRCLRTTFRNWFCPCTLLKQDLSCFLAVFPVGATQGVSTMLQGGSRHKTNYVGFCLIVVFVVVLFHFWYFCFISFLFVLSFEDFFSVFVRTLNEIRLVGRLGECGS